MPEKMKVSPSKKDPSNVIVRNPSDCYDSLLEMYLCPQCGGDFPTPLSLCGHLSRLHNVNFELRCRYCDVGAVDRTWLDDHEEECASLWKGKYKGIHEPSSQVTSTNSSSLVAKGGGDSGRSTRSPKKNSSNHSNGTVTPKSPRIQSQNSTDSKRREPVANSPRKGPSQEKSVENSANNTPKTSPATPKKCGDCPKSFPDDLRLREHVEAMHDPNPKTFSCSLCPNTFAHQWSLKKHEKLHSSTGPELCSKCNCRFSTKAALGRHLTTCMRDASSSGSSEEPAQNSHSSSEGQPNEKHKELEVPKRSESTKRTLKENQGNESNSSDIRRSRNSVKRTAITDVDSHSSSAVAPSVSSYSIVSTSSTVSSDDQSRTKKGKQKKEKVHPCKLCNRSFAFLRMLDTHMKKSHSESPVFKCTLCKNAVFTEEAELDKHMKKYHSSDGKEGKTPTPGPVVSKAITAVNRESNDEVVELDVDQPGPSTSREIPKTPQKSPVKMLGGLSKCSICNQTFMAPFLLQKHLAAGHSKKKRQSKQNLSSPQSAKTAKTKLQAEQVPEDLPKVNLAEKFEKKKEDPIVLMECKIVLERIKVPDEVPKASKPRVNKRKGSGHLEEEPAPKKPRPSLECEICHKMFTAPNGLGSHMRTHRTKPSEEPCGSESSNTLKPQNSQSSTPVSDTVPSLDTQPTEPVEPIVEKLTRKKKKGKKCQECGKKFDLEAIEAHIVDCLRERMAEAEDDTRVVVFRDMDEDDEVFKFRCVHCRIIFDTYRRFCVHAGKEFVEVDDFTRFLATL